MCYNLKKLLKFNRLKLKIIAKALQKELIKTGELLFFFKQPHQALYFQF